MTPAPAPASIRPTTPPATARASNRPDDAVSSVSGSGPFAPGPDAPGPDADDDGEAALVDAGPAGSVDGAVEEDAAAVPSSSTSGTSRPAPGGTPPAPPTGGTAAGSPAAGGTAAGGPSTTPDVGVRDGCERVDDCSDSVVGSWVGRGRLDYEVLDAAAVVEVADVVVDDVVDSVVVESSTVVVTSVLVGAG